MAFLPDLVVRSHRVVTPRGSRSASVHIRGGRIVGVLEFADVPEGCPLDDAGDLALIPGVVDTHVHINEPGRTDWEGFETATRAAAAGGVTTLVEMPLNAIPPTTTASGLEAKRDSAKGQCHVDVAFWGGVVPGNAGDLAALWEAGVLGFKCFLVPSGVDEFPSCSETDLRAALPVLAKLQARLLAHAELPGPIAEATSRLDERDGRGIVSSLTRAHRRYDRYLESRPKDAESHAIALLIALCREYRSPVHIVHLSSSDALAPIFHARSAGLPITVETCPHYLVFVAEEVPDGATEFKCAPPIRDRANRELLWGALAGGLIQMVVSDHSPAPEAIKERRSGDFMKAWGGISSLQVSLPATWTAARERHYTLDRLVEWMCRNPARFAGLSRKGAIDVGLDADLVVFDPEAERTVEKAALHNRHPLSPYLGRRLAGVVERTYLRGVRIFERPNLFGAPRGQLLSRT